MNFNLKVRKDAKSEEPAPEQQLAMAGAPTPWAPPPTQVVNPFNEASAPTGMPSVPPPPPPHAPEDEQDEEAPAKKPGLQVNRQLAMVLAAVVVAGGGGYWYLNHSGSSSSDSSLVVPTVHRPAGAGARVHGAAPTGAARVHGAAPTGAARVHGAAPTAAAAPGKVRATTPAKGAATAPAKPVTASKPAAKPAAKPAPKAPVAGTLVLHAAMPGHIGEWSKLQTAKASDKLAKYDPDLGTSLTNQQLGVFGNSATDRVYLSVEIADHTAKAAKNALQVQQLVDADAQKGPDAWVVAKPYLVAHPGFDGTAACTQMTIDDVLAVSCSWVDSGTIGTFVAPYTAESQEGQILALVRGYTEAK